MSSLTPEYSAIPPAAPGRGGSQGLSLSLGDTSRTVAWLMVFQWLAGVTTAVWLSPRAWTAWANYTDSAHFYLLAAVFLGGSFVSLPVYLGLRYAEKRRAALEYARLEAIHADARAAKREADSIMAVTNQGLFLIDRAGSLGRQHSRALEHIFPPEALVQRNFLDLLRPYVSAPVHALASDYLGLMFDAAKKEKQIAKVNPLAQAELHFPSPSGDQAPAAVRHLEFRFSRLIEDGRITHLLVAVTDVTGRISLARQLAHTERKRERQVESLFNVLHVDPALLHEFLTSAETDLAAINESLRAEQRTGADGEAGLRGKLAAVLGRIHSIKGNAAMLRLEFFETRAHELEETLVELGARPVLRGDDLLALVLLQSQLQSDLTEMRRLLERRLHPPPAAPAGSLSADAEPAEPMAAATVDDLLASLDAYAATLAGRLGKEVLFLRDDFPAGCLSAGCQGIFRDLLIQLTRNALSHGIEPPAERAAAGKPAAGLLELRLTDDGATTGRFEFTFRDDGRGLPMEKLGQRAVEMGRASAAELAGWEPPRVAGLIFEPGFSTADAVSAEAGRGVGMSLMKTRVVDECGGEIAVDSTEGEGCIFYIALPA